MALSTFRILPALGLALLTAACGPSDQSRMKAMAEAEAAGEKHESTVTVAPAPAIPSAEDFVAKASAGDLFEVQSGQAAQARATRPAVKSFAAMLVHDHTRSSQDLKKAIAEAERPIAAGSAVSAEQQGALSALATVPPADFDRAFLQAQVKAHEEALALLQRYAEKGDVVSLKAYASNAAGVVQQHYKEASQLLEQVQ